MKISPVQMLKNEIVGRCRGVLVGSRAWGGSGPDSDWDYAVDEKYRKKLERFADGLQIKEFPNQTSSHDGSVLWGDAKMRVNAIFLPSREFVIWSEASKAMRAFKSVPFIQDRDFRIGVFTAVRQELEFLIDRHSGTIQDQFGPNGRSRKFYKPARPVWAEKAPDLWSLCLKTFRDLKRSDQSAPSIEWPGGPTAS